jgi:hypothetical protein
MTFQGLGMQMSFGDIMCNYHVHFFIPMVPLFPFKWGEGFLMGPYVVIFISFSQPYSIQGQISPYVKCNDMRLHHRV